MKIRITMKDPDGPYNCAHEAVRASLRSIEGIDDEEREVLLEERFSETMSKLKRWLDYGEYIRVEFDLEAGTATVLESKS